MYEKLKRKTRNKFQLQKVSSCLWKFRFKFVDEKNSLQIRQVINSNFSIQFSNI